MMWNQGTLTSPLTQNLISKRPGGKKGSVDLTNKEEHWDPNGWLQERGRGKDIQIYNMVISKLTETKAVIDCYRD